MAISHQEKMQRVQHALRLEAAQNHAAAAQIYRDLIKEDPGDAGLHYHLAQALLAKLEFDGSVRAIREAIRLRPTVPEFYAVLAMAYRASNRLDEAIRAADEGMKVDPANLSIVASKGDLHNLRGEIDEGLALMMPGYERGIDDPQYLVVLSQLLTSADRKQEARAVLERAVANPGISGQPAAWAHIHLGQILEKGGDYDAAWGHYQTGNRHRGTVFNPDQHDAGVTEAIAIWSKERMASLPRAKNRRSSQMVFIIGMPRSGTTLVEQIIASHPDAYGGGELNFITRAVRDLLTPTIERPSVIAQLDALRQPVIDRWSQRVQKDMTEPCPRAKRFTDKLPQNFLHIGMIELLFPEARIIHCRRDPRDTLISCYAHIFGGANNQPYAGDLVHLGRYYRAYERIVEHWKSVVSLPMLEVVYEDIVADLEGHTRKLIDFLGLDWHDACLRFWETKRDVVTASTDEVRRPIYTSSIGRWKRFEQHLAPMLQALGTGRIEGGGLRTED